MLRKGVNIWLQVHAIEWNKMVHWNQHTCMKFICYITQQQLGYTLATLTDIQALDAIKHNGGSNKDVSMKGTYAFILV